MTEDIGKLLTLKDYKTMKNGFSLLELSIVLVIIGLIAGGIVAGSSMIRAAELRAVITQQTQFKIAVHTFRDKYFALPGDMKNATAFWGAADGGTGSTSSCLWVDTTDATTCNGNGDGFLHHTISSIERVRFWQHLANAGLISGNYSNATPTDSYYTYVPGANAPEAKLSGAGWGAANTYYSTSLFFPGTTGQTNKFWLASPQHYAYPVLTQEEAWNIDKKTDDGKPAYGDIRALTNHPWLNACTTALTADAEYDISSDSVSCTLLFEFK